MINTEKQIQYWKDSSQEDFEAARELIKSDKIRHGLFFLHLSVEKMLKAHVCKNTKDIPPRSHNLIRLLEISEIILDPKQTELLAELNPMNLEGRYPETYFILPGNDEVNKYLEKTEELLVWLKSQL